jgi:hypothetical protein
MRLLVLSLCAFAAVGVSAQSNPEASEPRILIVVAQSKDLDANHYLWTAEIAASRLPGENKQVLEGGLVAALREARAKPGSVRGIVEIVVNVYAWDEDVTIGCFDASGKRIWKKKSSANTGGSEEKLARNMFERTLQKAEKMPPCGGRR